MVNFDQISLPKIHTHHGRFRPNFALHAPLPPTPSLPSHGSVPRQPSISWPASTPQRHAACAARLGQPLLRVHSGVSGSVSENDCVDAGEAAAEMAASTPQREI